MISVTICLKLLTNLPGANALNKTRQRDDVHLSCWRHRMETTSALLATGNRWIPCTQPVTRSFDVFLNLHLNKRLSKQWWGCWFEIPSRPLLRHCNVLKIGFDMTICYFSVHKYICFDMKYAFKQCGSKLTPNGGFFESILSFAFLTPTYQFDASRYFSVKILSALFSISLFSLEKLHLISVCFWSEFWPIEISFLFHEVTNRQNVCMSISN